MLPHRKLLFVLADGGRARFVRYSPVTDAFVTEAEADHTGELNALRAKRRGETKISTFVGASPHRRGGGEDNHLRHAKEAFAAQVAGVAAEMVREQGLEGVIIVAPARLTGALRASLDHQAPVKGVLTKNLTKTPDHALKEWLSESLIFPGAAA
jgi:protein required for attachment to host cells